MVYDPVRDREVPSPATVLSQHRDIWRDFSTPGSSFSSTGEETRVITNRRSQPPAFDSSDMRSPIVLNSRSVSGGLRGLLNDEADVGRRRSSEQRSSISSTLEEEGSRASIHHLLNDTPAPVIHSRSSTSLAHSTSPSNPSPSARHHPLDPNSLLAPTTPAPNYPHHHRTSNRTENIGSVAGPMSLSQHDTHYTTPQIEPRAGPSRPGQSVGPSYRPMLPPHDLPPQYFDPAIRVTPNSSHVPLRSISVSLSPRSYHTGLPVYNASRPSSTTSTPHSFSNPPPLPSLSPPMSSRAFSEEHSHQPSSGSNSNGRRGAVPLRRSSQVTPIFSPLYAKVRSTSPPPRPVYDPHRISRPSSVMRPIEEAEILHLRNLALSNNPLRQRTKRAIASWSNLSPGIRDSSVPSESSHFALQGAAGISKGPRRPTFQDDRISFSSSNGRASLTSDIAVYPTVSGARLADGFAGFRGTPPRDSGTHDEYHHRKRPSDRDDDDEHDRFRRKVSDAFSEARHAGNAGAVAHHCRFWFWYDCHDTDANRQCETRGGR